MLGRVTAVIALVSILCFPHLSRAQYQFLINKTYAERYYPIDSLFFNKFPDIDSSTLFAQLHTLAEIADKAGDEELYLEAQVIKTNYYYSGRQKNYQLFEQSMFVLKKTADEKEIVQLQIRTRLILATYYFDVKKQYGLLFENQHQAYNMLKDIPAKDFPNKQELIMDIAGKYYYLGDYVMAEKYLHEAINTPPSYKSNSAISAVNTLGLIFRGIGKYDSADHYFKRTMSMADSMHDDLWRGIASGNLGISYYLQKKYDEAVPLLKYDVEQSVKGKEIDNALTSLVKLAKINYLQGNKAEAAANMSYARALVNNARDPYKHLVDLYPMMAGMSRDNANTALAYAYADSAIVLRDSMNIRKDAALMATAEQKLDVQMHDAQLLLKEAEKKQARLIRNWLITIIAMMAVIGVLFINRQKLQYKQRQMRLEAEKQSAELQLHEFTRIAQEKTALIEQISAELEKQTALHETNKEVTVRIDLLEQLKQSTLLTNEQWDEFSAIFEKAHRGYITRLAQLLPGLTPAETRYMVLSKLKLTDREMAGMLGISAIAIRQYRHRLRKKLDLKEDGDLEELINQI